MLLAESAVLLCFHTIGMCLLVLLGIVVSVLALCAGKCNSGTHIFTSLLVYKSESFTAQKKDLISSRRINITQQINAVNRFFTMFFQKNPSADLNRR